MRRPIVSLTRFRVTVPFLLNVARPRFDKNIARTKSTEYIVVMDDSTRENRMTDFSFDGQWALIMEGDESGMTADVAFITEAAAAAHPGLEPIGSGAVDLEAYPTIMIEGHVAWRSDQPDVRGTCTVDGDAAVVEISDPSPDAAGWIERLTLLAMDSGDMLSGTMHSIAPRDGRRDVANDDDERSEVDLGICDPCTLIRKV
jgi:hypothetical protein